MLRGITGNRINISNWYTIFDLRGIYYLILGIDWIATNLHVINHKTNTLHLLEPNYTDLEQGSHLASTIGKSSLSSLRRLQQQCREVWAHCSTAACRSAINMVSTSFVTKGKSFEIFTNPIPECINLILEEEGEVTPQKSVDLKTWHQHVRKAFADLLELAMRISPAFKYDFHIDTNPTAKPPHCKPYQMAALGYFELETEIAMLQAKGWVTDSLSQCVAPVIFVEIPAQSGSQMCVHYSGLNAITTRDLYPLP